MRFLHTNNVLICCYYLRFGFYGFKYLMYQQCLVSVSAHCRTDNKHTVHSVLHQTKRHTFFSTLHRRYLFIFLCWSYVRRAKTAAVSNASYYLLCIWDKIAVWLCGVLINTQMGIPFFCRLCFNMSLICWLLLLYASLNLTVSRIICCNTCIRKNQYQSHNFLCSNLLTDT